MKYVSINISYFNNTPVACSKCWGVIDSVSCQSVYKNAKSISYTQAMRELRKFERRLHKVAELDVNRFNPKLSSKTLWGWVEGA